MKQILPEVDMTLNSEQLEELLDAIRHWDSRYSHVDCEVIEQRKPYSMVDIRLKFSSQPVKRWEVLGAWDERIYLIVFL